MATCPMKGRFTARNVVSLLLVFGLVMLYVNDVPRTDVVGSLRSSARQLHLSAAASTAHVAPRTVALAINTPKTGTGGLSKSFADSLPDCVKLPEVNMTVHYPCATESHAVKSHKFSEAAELMTQLRSQQVIDQCLIATSIRNPQEWLPSAFMEINKAKLCDATLTIGELEVIFLQWLAQDNVKWILEYYVNGALPPLLTHFGESNLTRAFHTLSANGGFAKYTNPPADGPFAGCTLLFLQVEQSHLWPGLVASQLPGIVYERNPTRKEFCPGIAEAYASLGNFELEQWIRDDIARGKPALTEYFQLYGYIEQPSTMPPQPFHTSTKPALTEYFQAYGHIEQPATVPPQPFHNSATDKWLQPLASPSDAGFAPTNEGTDSTTAFL